MNYVAGITDLTTDALAIPPLGNHGLVSRRVVIPRNAKPHV